VYKVLFYTCRLWSESPGYDFKRFLKGGTLGIDATPILLGVGYIIGPKIAALMLSGAVLGYLGIGPLLSFIGDQIPGIIIAPGEIPLNECDPAQLRNFYIKYLGVGAVAVGGFVLLKVNTTVTISQAATLMLVSSLFFAVGEILVKQFVNRSKITMRYAFLNADRTRGIPAWLLEIDEFQDILADNLPVIEQTLSHAPERWKRYIYSGTPKSLDNSIEYYRARLSTQGEWVVPCEHHSPRHWNILSERNIGKKGLVCEKCHKLIDPAHPDAQWANMVDEAPFESYRIPQLMVPWKSWEEILLDYERYPRDKFYNEVLGISYDSGLRPLTLQQVKDCCNPDIYLIDYEAYRSLSFSQPIYAGIDWGTGEHSYTVLTLATYINMKFRIFYIHRFTGQEVDPPVQLEMIDELLTYFNVRLIGTDYGGGFDRNDHLVRKFGPSRVWKYQYMARSKKKLEWDTKLGRFKVHRTEVMSDIFNAIKRGNQVEFPRWEDFSDPYATDMINIFSEYNEALHMLQYKHGVDKPDDAFHSVLYAWVVSMIQHPRPDIIIPRKEEEGQQLPIYTGPTYQG